MKALARALAARDEELRPLAWAAAYFFFLFASYFVIRPVRDAMAVAGGVRNLPWLFSATLLATLLVHPVHAAVVSRLPRRRFIPLVYEFFALNLLAFLVLLELTDGAGGVWAGRAFYVWTSVFNLFVVSVFWSYMADVFLPEQATRLFAVIAVGGTLGGVAGSSLASVLAEPLGPPRLLAVSFVLLQIAVLAAVRLGPAAQAVDDEPVGGTAVDGAREILRSPYLLGICGYMLLYTITSTFLYFLKAQIVADTVADAGARTAFFARVDLAVNLLTASVQLFLTGRLLRWLGLAVGLAVLPVLTVAGFLVVGVTPTLLVVAAFEVVRRATNYAVSRPSREILYTAVSRAEKYKAKHLIDTFVYRAGDQVGIWAAGLVTWLGYGIVGVTALAAPVAGVWAVLAVGLGFAHRRRVTAAEGKPADNG